ncbi:MAG: sugar transferase [Culicoidibacterales bacterium]
MNINNFFKRIFDLLVSLIALILLSPLLIIVAISIKVTSKGPVLFKQMRLGRNGEEFAILKYRTMVVNAEKIGDGIKINSENDNRITSIGRFLRKTSIDELPQLVNVIKGDMSLVGPRPPVTYHPYKGYKNYPEWAKKRFKMKPGITGLAQVKLRNSATWEERIKIDNIYCDNMSFMLDLKILFLTVYEVINPKQLYKEE